jgi:hypothetical protein
MKQYTTQNKQNSSLKWKHKGISKGKLNQSQGGPPGLSPHRKDGSCGSQAERLDCGAVAEEYQQKPRKSQG